ncbi:MAG TPA: hypothetical protein VFX20_07410 [Steroidobacteraceae bacterium]|nr:hypothetical protein [Steroidobacteraceae bacterium]
MLDHVPTTLGLTIDGSGTFTNTSCRDGDATTKFNWTLGATNPGDAIRFSGDAKARLYVQASFTDVPPAMPGCRCDDSSRATPFNSP